MILGVGIDIIDNRRFDKWLKDKELLKRYFSEREIKTCLDKPSPRNSLAARFAAKEALIKASGLSLNLRDIEVLNDRQGRVYMITNTHTKSSLNAIGVDTIHISLSHECHYSIAYVLLEKNLTNQ